MTASDETLEDFKNSFNYGTRADLAFKFLSRLSPDEAGEFFKELLTALGETIDDGDSARLIDHAYSWQVRAYAAEPAPSYEDAPFSKPAKAVAQSRLMLISSGGHFVAGEDPKPFGVEDMSQQEAMTRILDFLRAAPVLSLIPIDTPAERLRVRHGGYDTRGAAKDHNVILPLDRLRELRDEGLIGDLAANACSFVGATSQGRLKGAVPDWVDLARADAVDAVLLVPG